MQPRFRRNCPGIGFGQLLLELCDDSFGVCLGFYDSLDDGVESTGGPHDDLLVVAEKRVETLAVG